MSDIERNIDWDTVEYFARAGVRVRLAQFRGAYRVWVERFRPFSSPGWWSFDSIEEANQFTQEWLATLSSSPIQKPPTSSISSTSTV